MRYILVTVQIKESDIGTSKRIPITLNNINWSNISVIFGSLVYFDFIQRPKIDYYPVVLYTGHVHFRFHYQKNERSSMVTVKVLL